VPDDGLTELEQMRQRSRRAAARGPARTAPPARHPAAGEGASVRAPAPPVMAMEADLTATGPVPALGTIASAELDTASSPMVGTDLRIPEPAAATVTARIRASLDRRLSELAHQLRLEGRRTSKTELVELFLIELPDRPTGELRGRLSRARARLPRSSGEPAVVSMTCRIRQSLDYKLSDLVHQLRMEGLRVSRVDLIEMCAGELPDRLTEDLRQRLADARTALPR
jgi:hypothetical protein